jgi:uncharacterized protein YegP (UPF0339 family)
MKIFEKVIDFDINHNRFVVGLEDYSVVDFHTSEILLKFKNILNKTLLILNGEIIFASDLYGENKISKHGIEKEVDYIAKSSINSTRYVVHNRNIDHTELMDVNQNILWSELGYPWKIFNSNDIVILLKPAEAKSSYLCIVKISTGELINVFKVAIFPDMLGINENKLFICDYDTKELKSMNIDTGEMVNEIPNTLLEELYEHGKSMNRGKFWHNCKYDIKTNSLIHPYGNFDLETKTFNRNHYFDNSKTQDYHFFAWDSIFIFDEDILCFWVHEDDLNTKDSSTRLVIINRKNNIVLYNKPVNQTIIYASISKMKLINKDLYYLDAFGNLHYLDINSML